MPKLPAATTALPQEHGVGVPRNPERKGESNFPLKANQHIWSHWVPDSRQALCCSSPIPCNSASRWQNSKATPTAHILPVLPAPHNTQLPCGAAGEPKPSAVSPAQGYSHEVTTASFRKLLKHGELFAWSETTQCFSTPEHTHCCCVFTAHFTA